MEIREITKSDLPILAKMDSEIFKDSKSDHVVALFKNALKNSIPGSSLVAEENKEIIGAIVVEKGSSFSHPLSAYVRSFFIAPLHQNKGVGKSLMSASLEAMKKNDITFVYLETFIDSKRAIGFYEKMGFSLNRYRYAKEL